MSISSNPYDRVSPELKKQLKKKNLFFDVHTHIFNYRDVPDGFLGIRFPFNTRFLKWIEHILHRIFNRTDSDTLSNLAYFIQFFRNKTSKDATVKLIDYYPDSAFIFCPLMMDMEPGIKGVIIDDYKLQIEKMKEVRDEFPHNILPFFAADPNNPELEENFLKVFASDNSYKFFGLKIYPSLGYLPSHPELMKIFEICEINKIPVTAHCGGATVHASKKEFTEIPGFYFDEELGWTQKTTSKTFRRKKEYGNFFNHPRNWIPVLEHFPGLKLNLAHFGGDSEWEKYSEGKESTWVHDIIELIYEYPDVYTDFSFTMYSKKLRTALKNLLLSDPIVLSRMLYGSDYYMIVKEGHFRAFKNSFINEMGEEIMKKLAVENPLKFLFE